MPSTLLALPNNEYLCAWFAGTKEGNPDTAIWLSHLAEVGYLLNKWQVAQTAHWNPVLFSDAENIYLFFKIGPSKGVAYLLDETFLDASVWSQLRNLFQGTLAGGVRLEQTD